MTDKDLLIKEYLRARKEAIYSRVIFLLTAVTGAILSFILVYSKSRNLIFENVSIGLVVFAGIVISRPYWTKKKQYENQYPELKGMSTRGAEASGNFLGKTSDCISSHSCLYGLGLFRLLSSCSKSGNNRC